MQKSPFEADGRNLGGRTQTANRMYGHQKAINDMKPTINIKDQPRKHVDAGKNKKPLKYKQQQTYGNVIKTFEAIGTINKPIVNTNKPDTMKFKHMNTDPKKLKQRVTKQNKHIDYEHMKNLEAQQRRMDALNSKVERKKNANDPVAHPVILFRRGNDKQGTNHYMKTQGTRSIQMGMSQRPSTAMNSSYAKEGGQPISKVSQIQQKKDKNSSEMQDIKEWYRTRDVDKKKLQPVHDKNQKKRPLTAQERKQFEQMYQEGEEDYLMEVPKAQGKNEEDYQYIKVRVIELIVKYRIYSTEDLKILEGRTLVENREMDRNKIEDIFKEILDDLDK